MAEANDTPSAPSGGAKRSGAGFELRLERGGAYVRLVDQPVAPGIRLESLTLQIPDVKFPFDVGQGAGQFRHRLADLVELSVAIEPSAAEAPVAGAGLAAFGIEDLQLAPRDGFLEIAGRLSGGPAFTLEAGLLAAGEQGVALVFHSPRLLGPGPIPSAALPHVAHAVREALGPEALPREPLAPLLRRVLAPRGWKLPRTSEVRLARAVIADGVARIAWDRAAGGPALTSSDPELLAAEEGARTFRVAEALLARGNHAAAREAYLAAGPAASAHPFAVARLLSLLAFEERFHDEALDLAAQWLARRPAFGAALAAEGKVRLARGEEGRAARAWAGLAADAAERGRIFLALAAAESACALPGAGREDALRAAEAALRVRHDHVPALRALRSLARAAGDREALLRANRRLVAHDPEPASKARAHAELGELLLEADPPGARLHLDHALRLAPEDEDALAALARACAAAGEPLRAIRALDRLKEIVLARGDRARAAEVAAQAGTLWEGPLAHPENALLRHREAAELAPSADAHARAAAAAEKAGQWGEAAEHHAATLAALDADSPGAAALAARTRVALADVAERRLGDPSAAAAHLEKAAALAPDAGILRRLVGLQRSLGRTGEAIAGLDALARLEPDDAARAAVLAEAGEAAAALGRVPDALGRFSAALAADGACRPALLGVAQLARERGDAVAEREALERLVLASPGGAERAEVEDRLAGACERTGDLPAALHAAAAAHASSPSPARLDASLRLARQAGDPGALAALLRERARSAAAAGDPAAATSDLLERAGLLSGASPAEALAALAEARALSPGNATVLRAQADLAERCGDPLLALGCLRALLGGAPDDAAALELRAARAAVAGGDTAAAKDHAERAFARGAPGAAELLDEILERAGDDAARADVLTRLGRHLEAARLLERHGDAARARTALERAAADPGQAPQALVALVEVRLGEGDRPGAADALLALARLTDGREGARLALRAHAIGRDPGALDLAIGRDPRFAPALARRAALRAAADPRAALADAEAALSGEALPEEERAELLALAARTAAAAGDGAKARRHLDAYCDAAPDDDGALARLAALHRAAGARHDLARVLARRLPLAAGADAAAVRIELSDLLAEPEPAAAARLAREALEHDPASVGALRALTTPPRAAHVPPADRSALLERLAAIAPATPEEEAAVLGARARLLSQAGDAAGALAAAREAARLARESDDLLELRAELAARTGDRADAAGALLARARRARDRQEPGAAERLAHAGLEAVAADVEGADEALRDALALSPDRETCRVVLEAVVARARARGDAAAERHALGRLVPLLPTGARPVALVRHSVLALAAGDATLARASADEARTLAPRDASAVEACHAAALASGDLAAAADLLRDAARLDPAAAGPRLLERARLLAGLGRAEEADDAFREALAALPPDRALADEHSRLRRERLPARSAARPLEAFALRTTDPSAAAHALRTAAAIAVAADDAGAAVRCARGAYARTQVDLAFAGPLLARVLYLRGARQEALEVHRRLLDAGLPGVAPEEAIAVCRQAADLAEEAGDVALALRALDDLLRHRPQDVEAALLRFELDPDRSRSARALADAAGACRSRRRRALALAAAAERAIAEPRDRAVAGELLRRAREEASGAPAVAAEILRRAARAVRAAEGASSPAYLEALHEAAAAAQEAGDRGAARDFLEEAVARQRERGLFSGAARDVLHLDALAVADGDFAESGARLRTAAALQEEGGDLASASETLRRAYLADPSSEATSRQLEAVLRARGEEGSELLAELLADRASRSCPAPAPPGAATFAEELRDAAADPDRMDALLSARAAAVQEEAAACHRARGDALHAVGRSEDAIAAYQAAVAAAPDDAHALVALAGCVADACGDEAAAELDRHLVARAEIDPEAVPGAAEAPSRYRLGLALAAAGDADAAIAQLGRAVLLAPADASAGIAFAALAQAHAARGDAAAALGAARARVDRAIALGLEEEVQWAVEAEQALAADLAGSVSSGPDLLDAEPAFLAEAFAEQGLSFEAAARADPDPVLDLERGPEPPSVLDAGSDPETRAGAGRPSGAAADAVAAPAFETERAATGPGLEPAPGEAPASDAAVDPATDPLASAREAAARAEAATSPAGRAAAWIASAEALARAGAPPDDVRSALDLACDADPDAVEPWRARARLETTLGDPLASARAQLAVSIRAEGDEAARAALEAARLFDEAGQHSEAARAYRAAVHADPAALPQQALLAAEALAAGETAAAADLLSAIDPARLPEESRGAHARKLARALDAAGRADEAERAWTSLLAAAPADAEAFDRAAALALERGGIDAWIEVAAAHEGALATWGETERQRDLRHERGRLLAEAGRTEAARGAFHSALELDPGHGATHESLSALDARRDDWAATAAALAEEAAGAMDGAEGAALYLRLGRILHERLSDDAGAIAALRAALVRARWSPSPAAQRTGSEAAALLDELGAPAQEDALPPGGPGSVPTDVVAAVLSAHAEAAEGAERADLLEQLARRLERTGDTAGAARALSSVLDADPERDGIASRLGALRAAGGETADPPASEGAAPAAPGTVAEDDDAASDGRGAATVGDVAGPGGSETETPSGVSDGRGAAATVGEAAVPGGSETASTAREPRGGSSADEGTEAERAARDGRALLEGGDLAAARERLSLALSLEPSDLTIARDLCRVAEKLGLVDEYVRMGEVCADAIAAYDPLAAAARFRHFAEVLRERGDDPERAAVMLEKALALTPDDLDTHRNLVAMWAEHPASAPRALEAWLEKARDAPSEVEPLASVVGLCERIAASSGAEEAARVAERGRLAASIAAFVSPSRPAPPPGRIAATISAELRARVAAPGATGPLAHLLGLLAPWLEPLFAADLRRRGVGAEERLGPSRAPALAAALERAARALGSRRFVAFLSPRPAAEAAIENTQPPALVFSSALADLGEQEGDFLAARTLDLLDHGWALAGKFAPRDLAILLELACRFAGGTPPEMGLPSARAGAFFGALETQVPSSVRAAAAELGPAAAEELAGTDPRALGAALRRTANRVALLYTGEPGAALRTLALLDHRLGGGPVDAAQAFALPDLRDIALFALSDPFLRLRAAVTG